MPREEEAKQLREEIKTLRGMSGEREQELASEKERELEALLAEAPPRKGGPMAEEFDTGMTLEDWDSTGAGVAKRPPVGDHEAEMGMPEDYSEKSFRFPFTITEKGAWQGYSEDAFYPGKRPWKDEKTGRMFFPLKNLCLACGVEPKVVDGKIKLDTTWLAQFAGKKFIAVYSEEAYKLETDRGVFEGIQSKVKSAKPLSEKVEDLGI